MRESKVNTRQTRQVTNRQTEYQRRTYVEGNTARSLDTVRELQQPVRRTDRNVRRNQEKSRYMNLPYVLFLTAAMVITGIMLIGYLQTQSNLTVSIKKVAALESQLNDMRLSNDEQLERINTSLDMEEIKRIAIEELGMTYAKEGQVVTVSGEGSDYVRQLVAMPE